MNKSILLASMCVVLSGCAAKTGHQFLAKMSHQEISEKLIENVTTKDQVRKMFGDPEDIDMRDNGEEYWFYRYTRMESKAVNYIPIASSFYGGTNDNTRKLKIRFTCNGVVSKYAFSNSKGETKAGWFQ